MRPPHRRRGEDDPSDGLTLPQGRPRSSSCYAYNVAMPDRTFSKILDIVSFRPDQPLTNAELSSRFPSWSAEKIEEKTGITTRFVADKTVFSADLGLGALLKLLKSSARGPDEIDFLLVVTQTPDFIFPGVSSFIHGSAGLRHTAGAMDVNLGCSGYVYALGVAKGLIESEQATNVVVVTTDTYSKLLNPEDRSVVSLFGDGATATWISGDSQTESITKVHFGSDGSKATALFVPGGGIRSSQAGFLEETLIQRGLTGSGYDLFMDGPEIFNFTLAIAERTLERTLELANLCMEDIDLFVFHQANAFLLNHMRGKLNIPESKFPIEMGPWGNTVSGTIPMAIESLRERGVITTEKESIVLLLGFGVGLSWAGTVARL